jgi:hypothetical protein
MKFTNTDMMDLLKHMGQLPEDSNLDEALKEYIEPTPRLCKDVRDLVMNFHEPSTCCELDRFIVELEQLFQGRCQNILSMQWIGWWDDSWKTPSMFDY